MAKRDGNYRMSNSIKMIYSGMSKEQRTVWRDSLVDADITRQSNERVMMLYDVSPSGKVPKKAKIVNVNGQDNGQPTA